MMRLGEGSVSPWVKFCLSASAITLVACGGGDSATPPPVTPPPSGETPPPASAGFGTDIDTKAEAAQFLRLAGLGGTNAEQTQLTNGSAVDWVTDQLSMSPVDYRVKLGARISEDDANVHDVTQLIYEVMIGSDAELRTRMAYALSQIFAINDSNLFNEGYGTAVWMDILDRNAFGNYRDLMGDVTRSPVMGSFLTYLYNWKGDDATGREPDENYARELLQLFTIGLHELNPDGTIKTDGSGAPVPTFSNSDVIGLARVFTGYALAGTSLRYRDRFPDTWERQMLMYDDFHETRVKSFLGTTIPENTPGEESIEIALDTIFAHPNVGPFVSRQLIQRFTASDPAPDYVARVSAAFEAGTFTADNGTQFGTGQRGDLSATIAAILLDEALHDETMAVREGKVREPVLNFVQFVRTFQDGDVTVLQDGWNSLSNTTSIADSLGQNPLRSPSVFNFYRPGFVAPKTESGDLGLTAPELQIVNDGSMVGYMNFMYSFISRDDGHWEQLLIPDLTYEIDLADDATALVDHLDLVLTGGRLMDETKSAIATALNALPIRAANDAQDRRSRVNIALTMVVISPEYMTLN